MNPTSEEIMQQLEQPYQGSLLKPLYTTEVMVTPGQEGHARLSGHARSTDGMLDIDLALPFELGGSGKGNNPEQLFAAGYAACFHGSMILALRKARIDASRATVACAVTINRDPEDKGYVLSVKLTATLSNLERTQAEKIVAQAHQFCPYSKAIQGNVDVDIEVVSMT